MSFSGDDDPEAERRRPGVRRRRAALRRTQDEDLATTERTTDWTHDIGTHEANNNSYYIMRSAYMLTKIIYDLGNEMVCCSKAAFRTPELQRRRLHHATKWWIVGGFFPWGASPVLLLTRWAYAGISMPYRAKYLFQSACHLSSCSRVYVLRA